VGRLARQQLANGRQGGARHDRLYRRVAIDRRPDSRRQRRPLVLQLMHEMREGIAAAQQAAGHGEQHGRNAQSREQGLSEIGQRAIGVVEGEERDAAASARLQELGKADKSITLIAKCAEDRGKVIDRDDHVGEAVGGRRGADAQIVAGQNQGRKS
jgi:hypothetical protein